MKNLYRYVIALTMTTMGIVLTSCVVQDEPMEKVIERGLNRTTEQALLMAKKLEPEDGKLPKSIGKDGKLEMSGYGWWCSGFYPGTLWYLYENTPIPELKKYAELYETLHHGHRFPLILPCIFVRKQSAQ